MVYYKKAIRRGQVISPFGPGGIIDIKGESFISCNAEQWRDQGVTIHEPRLQNLLKKESFRLAPAAPGDNKPHPHTGVPVFRFPDWLFCRKCRYMQRWSDRPRPQDTRLERPFCQDCKKLLTPMRFIMVCPHGHIDDVPWQEWCHKGNICPSRYPRLRFVTGQQRGGLEDVAILCDCGAERSLDGITKSDALQGISAGCTGRQPWDRISDKCTLIPLVKQRGATNIYFSQTASSIDIPPYSAPQQDRILVDAVMSSDQYSVYQDSRDEDLLDPLTRRLTRLLSQDIEGATFEAIREIMASGDGGPGIMTKSYDTEDDLKNEEYEAFLAPYAPSDPRDNFQKKDVSLPDAYVAGGENDRWNTIVDAVSDLLDRLTLITRLREVTAIEAFSRLGDPGSQVNVMRNDMKTPSAEPVKKVLVSNLTTTWLPAAEVFGEGIFFTLDNSSLDQWVRRNPEVRHRSAILRNRQANIVTYGNQTPVSPQYLLLHTITHLLIRQLTFTCGYGSSSLRERLYCKVDEAGNTVRAGALIYTSAGDSEGTLGGLVRQGRPIDFISTLVDALRNSIWCSSDPLCQESEGQGLNALNMAACHACSLLPETSCSERNRYLDRVLAVGVDGNMSLGYFAPVLEAAAI